MNNMFVTIFSETGLMLRKVLREKTQSDFGAFQHSSRHQFAYCSLSLAAVGCRTPTEQHAAWEQLRGAAATNGPRNQTSSKQNAPKQQVLRCRRSQHYIEQLKYRGLDDKHHNPNPNETRIWLHLVGLDF